MITLTRRAARGLRAVFRRPHLGLARRGPIPPLVLVADGGRLATRFQSGQIAVEHVIDRHDGPAAEIAIPLDALAELEGGDETPVVVQATGPGRTTARWEDRGRPRSRDYDVDPASTDDPFPVLPDTLEPAAPGLIDALAEARSVAGEDGARYALGCVQLRGEAGEVVATDGRHLLVRSRLSFPWDEDLLIGASPLFESPVLRREGPLRIGRTTGHVVLSRGPITAWFEIRKDVRFPRVDTAIPDPALVRATARIDPEDARTLLAELGDRPGDGHEEDDPPVTLDLNGKLAIRVRDAGTGIARELVLARSTYTGRQVRVAVAREHLARALRCGFNQIAISGEGSPLACRDRDRIYAFQPLDESAAIPPSEDVSRVEASSTRDAAEPASPIPTLSPTTRSEMDDRIARNAQNRHLPAPGGDGHSGPEPAGLAALIREAESLHASLGEGRARLSRLIAGLRRHRKQNRLLADAVKSLRQLDLAGPVE